MAGKVGMKRYLLALRKKVVRRRLEEGEAKEALRENRLKSETQIMT